MHLSLLFVFVLSAIAASAADPKPEQVDKVFEKLDRVTSPGCSLAVVREGKVIYARGYGMADLDHDIANTPRTVFHVASMSKQVTAAAIVLLAQRGQLKLDDPVRKYISEMPDFGTPVTIRHLVHHVSGLRDQWSLLVMSGWRLSEDVVRDQDVLDVVSRMKALNFPPGDRHLYSNTGYTLMAQIVSKVSGKSLREFTTREIFEPLGMRDTHFRDDHQETVKGMAYGYARSSATWRQSIPHYDTVGASSLLTTVEDWVKWDHNFDDPKVGGRALVEQMLEPYTLNKGEKTSYRFGLVTGKYRGLPTVGHNGADAGYRSAYVRFPDQKLSVTCLCNAVVNPPVYEVAALYLSDRMTPEPAREKADLPAVAMPAAELEKAAGVYWNAAEGQVLKLRLNGSGKLAMSLANEGELKPVGPGRFHTGPGPTEIRITGEELTLQGAGVADPDRYRKALEWKPSAAEMQAVAGNYYSEELDSTYRIEVKDGQFQVVRKKYRPHETEPTLQDVLFVQRLGLVRLQRGANGAVTGFQLTAGRIRNLQFRRTP